MLIEIFGTAMTGGGQSTIKLSVGGVKQDLNSTSAAGNGYAFTWDSEGPASMGFASNNTPVEGAAGNEVFRASGIDNWVIAIPEPSAATLILAGLVGLITLQRRYRR